jgi:Uma2 family endonuclease
MTQLSARTRRPSRSHATFEEVLPLHAIAPDTVRPLKRVEYEQLARLGAFGEERIELVYGVIVRMSPIGMPHAAAVTRLTELLVLALHTRAKVRPGLPLVAGEISLPQPALAVVPREDDWSRHPDVAFLVIEVSESTLRYDRGVKRALYAECGIPEYWIVNLVDGVIDVHDRLVDGAYTRVTSHARGASIVIGAFPDVSIEVSDVIQRSPAG